MSKKNKLKAELILEVAQLQERVRELESGTCESIGQDIIEYSPDHIFTLDLDLKIQFVNHPPPGLKTEELVGTPIFRILAKEKQAEIKAILTRVIKTKKPALNETEYHLPDGGLIYYETHTFPRMSPGKVFGLIVILCDITERKQTELALSKTFHLSQYILNTIQTIILVLDPDGKIIRINPYLEKISGYPSNEVEGKDWFSTFLPKRDQEKTRALFQYALHNTPTKGNINPIICKDGKEIYIEWYDRTMMDEDGKIIGLLSTGQDISARLDSDLELQNSEARFRAIFEQAAIGAALLETKTGRYIQINQKYCDLLGYTLEEMLTKTFQDVTFPDDVQENEDYNALLMAGKIPQFSIEKRYIRKNGSTMWGSLTASPIWSPGEKPNTYFHIAILEDITEQKQEKEILRTLLQISQAADQAESLADLFQNFHQIIKKVMPAENLYIALYDQKQDLLTFPYYIDEKDAPLPPKKPGKGLTEYVLRLGKPLFCDQTLFEELIQRGEIELIGTNSAIWLGVPLITSEGVIGIMALQDYQNTGVYSRVDLQFLELISFQAAEAIVRLQNELTIRKSEIDLRKAQEYAHLGSWTWDIKNDQQSWSDEMYNIFGISKTDFSGNLSEVINKSIHPDVWEQLNQSNLSIIHEGKTSPLEYQIRLPDGSIRVVRQEAGDWEFDQQGNLSMLKGYIMDITNRKRAEEELQSLAKFPSEDPSPVLRIAQDDTLLYINSAGITLLPKLHLKVGQIVPPQLQEPVSRSLDHNQVDTFSLEHGKKQYKFTITPIADGGYANLYGVDVTDLDNTIKNLEQSQQNLRSLTAYWQNSIEAERTQISREIHDEFGQHLTALKMDLAWLAKRMPEADEKVERIHDMNMLIDKSIKIVRRIATDLRPNLIDDLGLIATLKWQASEFSQRTNISCELNLPEQDPGLDPALNTTLFRIFQETLTNVARHAEATSVNISLKIKDQTLILTFRDNGRGITKDKLDLTRSLGLLGMRERAIQWGGETTFHGEEGKGTTVTVRIPLPPESNNGGKP